MHSCFQSVVYSKKSASASRKHQGQRTPGVSACALILGHCIVLHGWGAEQRKLDIASVALKRLHEHYNAWLSAFEPTVRLTEPLGGQFLHLCALNSKGRAIRYIRKTTRHPTWTSNGHSTVCSEARNTRPVQRICDCYRRHTRFTTTETTRRNLRSHLGYAATNQHAAGTRTSRDLFWIPAHAGTWGNERWNIGQWYRPC